MRVVLVLALAVFIALPALAKTQDLTVTVKLNNQMAAPQYRLTGEDVREFWQRWGKLDRVTDMVPLKAGSGYGGLSLRESSSGKSMDVFNGTVRRGTETRSDPLRQLERWVLSKAPPPYGPSLLAALDDAIRQDANASATARPGPNPTSADTAILNCLSRARGNHQLRALCLEEKLREHLSWRDYANALQKVLEESAIPREQR